MDSPLNLDTRPAPQPQVVKQAIQWMLRLRNEAPNPHLQQQCRNWRAAHQDHELAWQRVHGLQRELSSQLSRVPGAGVAFETLENSSRQLGRRQALKLLSGVLMLGSAAWLARDSLAWQQWTADFATATGERRSFHLPDGTRLQLDTDSAVDLHFNAGQRLMSLNRGEIMVTCGAEHAVPVSRPLRVESRHGLFEGREARFVLREEPGCTRLSVASGNVLILSPASGGTIEVPAGQSYRVSARGAQRIAPPDMDIGAWADGLIVTRNMRLADFLDEVGRYRRGYLGCAADIADLRLSGVFRLEDTDKLLALLPRTLPVQVRYRTGWWVTLERQA